MPDSKPLNNSKLSMEIQVHLTEYQKTRDEIIHWEQSASQSLLLSLSSSSIILPILFSQVNNVPKSILGLFLCVLSIVYAVIGMHYATSQYYVIALANYVHQSLAPKINLRLQTSTKNYVLNWENWGRSARHNLVALYLSSIGAIATGFIILMPSLVSLLFAQYVFHLPPLQTSQSISIPQILVVTISPLSITAWIFFILSALSQILVMVHSSLTGFATAGSAKE